jgi:hypothetical protein
MVGASRSRPGEGGFILLGFTSVRSMTPATRRLWKAAATTLKATTSSGQEAMAAILL